MGAVEFRFEDAPTRSHPAAMWMGDGAPARGVRVDWRPVLLGPILAGEGMTDGPFDLTPVEGRYMWRDRARILGAPSFVVDGALFWGQDRMAAAPDRAASPDGGREKEGGDA